MQLHTMFNLFFLSSPLFFIFIFFYTTVIDFLVWIAKDETIWMKSRLKRLNHYPRFDTHHSHSYIWHYQNRSTLKKQRNCFELCSKKKKWNELNQGNEKNGIYLVNCGCKYAKKWKFQVHIFKHPIFQDHALQLNHNWRETANESDANSNREITIERLHYTVTGLKSKNVHGTVCVKDSNAEMKSISPISTQDKEDLVIQAPSILKKILSNNSLVDQIFPFSFFKFLNFFSSHSS